MTEVRYDASAETPVIRSESAPEGAAPQMVDGLGCHAGAAEMNAAARAAGKSDILDRYAADYPKGPHDQPQSMCPAFGSLRVGLRMRRVATVLSGSACCVYGLTFVSHFYGARRSVGYVPFNSETLVTGKLFEDIRDAVHDLADPDRYDAIVVTNLCVPTASGVPLRLLPDEINGVRIVGIDVPGFGVPTHAEAKDVLAGAMLAYARSEAEAGPVQAPANGRSDRPTVTLLGEMFPADPVMIGAMLAPSALPPDPSFRPVNGANSMPRSTVPPSPRSTRSTRPASANFRPPVAPSSARPPSVSMAPPPGWPVLATSLPCPPTRLPPRRTPSCPRSVARWPRTRSRAPSRCRATRAPNSSSRVC